MCERNSTSHSTGANALVIGVDPAGNFTDHTVVHFWEPPPDHPPEATAGRAVLVTPPQPVRTGAAFLEIPRE